MSLSTRRKLYTSIFSLILIVIVTITGTTLTLSALNTTVRGGFDVTYTANHIAAQIFGWYKGGAETDYVSMQVDEVDASLEFTGSESGDAATKTFDKFHIVLTSDQSTAIIRYQIKNNLLTQKEFPVVMTVSLVNTTDETSKNMSVSYAVATSSTGAPNDPTTFQAEVPSITVGAVDTYIFIKFDVISIEQDARCNYNLSFVLGPA